MLQPRTSEILLNLLSHHVKGEIDLQKSFDALGMDSFALVTFRAELEHAQGTEIPDETWFSIERPAQLTDLILTRIERQQKSAVGATARRQLQIDMPQMAMGGLSEAWLFKEIGDIHWNILTGALGVKSRDIADQAGERLYATFTRIKYRATRPLSAVQENDPVNIDAAMTRFGAAMFFSSQKFRIGSGDVECEVMSSFSKIAESGNNSSLRKGQPEIPARFAVPELAALPQFAVEYMEARAAPAGEAIFTTEYAVVPQHDINGVGLLYFAAYPVIAEICLSRFPGLSGRRLSPVERDICYFANCGPEDRILYRIHTVAEDANRVSVTSSMTRASDGKQMALLRHHAVSR